MGMHQIKCLPISRNVFWFMEFMELEEMLSDGLIAI